MQLLRAWKSLTYNTTLRAWGSSRFHPLARKVIRERYTCLHQEAVSFCIFFGQRKYKLIAFSVHRHKTGRAALGLSCGACFEELACVFASSGALYEDIADAVTAVGVYGLRLLQIKRCGRLDPKAVLALDCCPLLLNGLRGSFRTMQISGRL